MTAQPKRGPHTPIAVIRAANERSPFYWLKWALIAEQQAINATGLSRAEVRAVLARQDPRAVVEAAIATGIHNLADALDDEHDTRVVDLTFRRALRSIGKRLTEEERS